MTEDNERNGTAPDRATPDGGARDDGGRPGEGTGAYDAAAEREGDAGTGDRGVKAEAPAAGPVGARQAGRGDAALPALGFKGTVRWVWTQLTSMRTALFLLMLLAVAAVPGSLFPQRDSNPEAVATYIENDPAAGEWLDRFQLFDVYSSVWFSAIYLLLFISLIGCILPRTKKHWQAMRTPPPRTPARLSRLPEHGTLELDAVDVADDGGRSDAVMRDAAALLRKRGYRVQERPAGEHDGVASVGAERGYVREVGNLVFHISLVGILASVAIGGAYGYSGQRILVEGESFVNTLVSYDSFSPGTAFDETDLEPFSVTLDDFDVTYDRETTSSFGQQIGFDASVTTQQPSGEREQQELRVNHPLRIGGASVYLVGNGYAPEVTVRDGQGNIAFQGPVPSVPQDSVFTSLMVLKVPDAQPDQLGFVGLFLPTAGEVNGVGVSLDPSPALPQLQLNSYYGDLGLDEGTPQNVYVLDTDTLTELNSRTLDAGGLVINPGETVQLPEGKGSISFTGLKRYVGLDVHHDPGKTPVLIFSVLALTGLAVSLFTPRRRVWVKVREDAETGAASPLTMEYGLLARGEDPRLEHEATELRALFQQQWSTPHESGSSRADD
ncbi:cytochrome c biogenesis protein ResB [Zhihengliuella sp.]|uniref:cytochrome c biogenesis protein ResB n=1 Tax=Zhihengliuella sp. TaxID=1954483 RepID=UPI002810A6C1|nr:cytochrome c biogenesis protein ResB [Zhihengliuella sp.]